MKSGKLVIISRTLCWLPGHLVTFPPPWTLPILIYWHALYLSVPHVHLIPYCLQKQNPNKKPQNERSKTEADAWDHEVALNEIQKGNTKRKERGEGIRGLRKTNKEKEKKRKEGAKECMAGVNNQTSAKNTRMLNPSLTFPSRLPFPSAPPLGPSTAIHCRRKKGMKEKEEKVQ